MIDNSASIINKVSVHHIGNKNNGEELLISDSELETDTLLREMLSKYFLSPFSSNEFYSFTFSNEDFKMNPLYQFCGSIFSEPKKFHSRTIDIAKQLYEVSDHPQIKRGDLFIAFIDNVSIENEQHSAIGIFKSENRQPFLKLDAKNEFSLSCEDGINVDKLDKGCLIFNTDEDSGYRVCIVDRSNKAIEAQFWKDDFLMIRPCKDEYHQTKDFLSITKNYVTKQLAEEFVVNRTEQIDILNRSLEYFKTRDTFQKDQFEEEVFQDKNIINSFRKFNDEYCERQEIDIEDSFEISAPAVKKQARVFKSVLKLDKNFHIYIHGDRNMIEQGIDADGRKYYKIYFENEA